MTIDTGGVSIVGEGVKSLIINGSTNLPTVQFGSGAIIYQIGCESVTFAQATGVTAANGNCGLYLLNCGQSLFSDLRFAHFPNNLYDGITFDTVSQSFVYAIQGGSCLNNGVNVKNCLDLYIDGGRSDANENDGWYIQGSQGLHFVNCSAYNNSSRAFRLDSGGSNSPPGNYNLHFVTCTGDTSGAYNWGIKCLSRGWFDNCWGSTQQDSGTNTYATGFYLSGPPSTSTVIGVDAITFTGGGALLNNSHGVQLYNDSGAPANILFIGFTFGNAQFKNGRSGSGCGLWVDTGCQNIRVIGCSASGNASGPIEINANVTDVVVEGLVTGSTSGSSVSVGGSPFTYTNVDGVNEQVMVSGGSVSQISILRDESTLTTGLSSGVFQLRPNDGLKITYSTAPTMKKIPA